MSGKQRGKRQRSTHLVERDALLPHDSLHFTRAGLIEPHARVSSVVRLEVEVGAAQLEEVQPPMWSRQRVLSLVEGGIAKIRTPAADWSAKVESWVYWPSLGNLRRRKGRLDRFTRQ